MDLRFVAFNLIARDATLVTLLANYARHLEDDGAPGDQAPSCFVSLSWAVDEHTPAPAGRELLTIHAHVSRDVPRPQDHLEGICERLRAALTTAGPNPCLTARCLTTSDVIADAHSWTFVKTSTWEIAAVQAESKVSPATRLVPWSVCGGTDAPGLRAGSAAAPSLN
ncbi:hypothetical protein ACI79G_04315 [Geodermatophilus sp. SYSU D00779]